MATTFSQLTENQPEPNDNFAFDSVADGNTYRVTLNDLGATAGAHAISTVADLQNAPTPAFASNGLPLLGYKTPLDGGGGTIVWDPNEDKQNHDGGIIISPTHSNSTFGDTQDPNWYEADPNDNGTGCWKRDIGLFVSPEMYGAFGDNTNDYTPALKAFATSGVPKKVITSGTYIVSEEIEFEGDSVVEFEAGAILDASSIGGAFSGDSVISCRGDFTQIAELGSDVSRGDRTITFASGPALSPGDVFAIVNPTDSSYSGFRPYYKAGEFCKVYSVSGSDVTLFNPVYDNYAVVDVDIYKINGNKIKLINPKVKGPRSSTIPTAKFDFCVGLRIEDGDFSNSDYAELKIDRCYDFSLENTNCFNDEPAAGLQYGVAMGHCQNGIITGGNYMGTRHGLDFGGGGTSDPINIVNRNVNIHGATIEAVEQFAASLHGNVEDIYYRDCTIYNGAQVAGKNTGYINCQIYGDDIGRFAAAREIVGGTHKWVGCDMYGKGDPSTSTRGLIDFGGNDANTVTSDTTEDLTIIVQNCTLENPNYTSRIVKVVNRGSLNKINIRADNLTLNTSNATGVVWLQHVSGAEDSDFLIVDGIAGLPDGARFLLTEAGYSDAPMRIQKQGGAVDITVDSTNNLFSENVIFTHKYPRPPEIQLTMSGGAYFAGQSAMVSAGSPSTEDVNLNIYETDNNNFPAEKTVQLNWTVGINDF